MMESILLDQISKITTRTADGVVSKLDDNCTIFYYKTLVPHKFIIENVELPYIKYKNSFQQYLSTAAECTNVASVQKSLLYGHIILLYNNEL